jgi:hypothetical protein
MKLKSIVIVFLAALATFLVVAGGVRALQFLTDSQGKTADTIRPGEARPGKTNAARQDLLDAVNANDLSKVRRLLPQDGTPGLDSATYQAALGVAADRFAEMGGTSSASQWLPVLEELSRRYRHLVGKPIEVAGTLSPGLTDNGGGNFTSGLMTLRTGDGASHKIAISAQETEYTQNTSLDRQRFLVNFDATYKIRGVLLGNVIEAERVELDHFRS